MLGAREVAAAAVHALLAVHEKREQEAPHVRLHVREKWRLQASHAVVSPRPAYGREGGCETRCCELLSNLKRLCKRANAPLDYDTLPAYVYILNTFVIFLLLPATLLYLIFDFTAYASEFFPLPVIHSDPNALPCPICLRPIFSPYIRRPAHREPRVTFDSMS